MPNDAHQYVFDPGIAFEDVEASLLLAIFAAESLHGEAQVRLGVAHAVDSDHRTCLIDAVSTPISPGPSSFTSVMAGR